jgi:hypothetical protein
MITSIIYAFFTLAYFSTIIAYTYDIKTNCNCEVKWYFNYLRYFSIVYLTLTIFIFSYAMLLVLSYNSSQIWYNSVAKYLILLLILFKTIGLCIYFVCFYKFQNKITNKGCGCYRGKMFDIIQVSTYVYFGFVVLSFMLMMGKRIQKNRILN